MRGKRELVARASAITGVTKFIESLPQRRVLLVLNYHRIGNSAETPFDSNVFSATAEEFDAQIAFFRRRFQIVSLPEALHMKESRGSGTALLITFDDGYLDNYTLAAPILRAHGVPAVFFLPTAFVGTAKLPWWDQIAYIIKKSRNRHISLHYPETTTFDLNADDTGRVSMRILRLFKQPAVTDAERFLTDLEDACAASRPDGNTVRCFLNWEEAREMQQQGLAFGSHTHSHEILAKLSPELQQEEADRSRRILEREMGRTIDVMAYPVGAVESFSAVTVDALKRAGYRAAFSFYGGLNRPGAIQAFDIRRYGVGDQSHARLRLQTALGAATGSRWF
jgi:peptidoglycan/xylan/chitin deacetylase (PgdA/CDA1 family)